MKKALILLISLIIPALCMAQNLSMTSDGELTYVSNDLDGKLNFPVMDRNNKQCALIKVTVINELKNPLTLSVGTTLEVVKTDYRTDGEVWFYIPTEVKNLEFRCKSYPPVKIPVTARLTPGGVYRITITANSTGTYVESAVVTSNYLKINVNPINAVFSIGRTQEYEISSKILTDGNFSMRLDYGEYYYKIEHEFYETKTGTLTVSSDATPLSIDLTPAYSYLNINTVPDGATVSVDGRYIGTSPVRISSKMKKGEVTIRAQKDLYYPEEITFSVPGDTLLHTATINLKPQFGTVTCTCEDSEAELWIDNQKVGIGTWTGHLSSSSSHYLEARKKGHLSRSINFEVRDGETSTHTVGGPEPLYGTIEITSTPDEAEVRIDGQTVGTTPFILNNVLIEDHRIELSKEGYIPYRTTFILEHNQHLMLAYTLEKGIVEGYINIKADPDSHIFAGDRSLGKGSWSGKLPAGEYRLRALKDGYYDGTTTVILEENGNLNVTIPSPRLITGQLHVTSNVENASIHLQKVGTDKYIYGETTPYTFSVTPGTYSMYLSKKGYKNSETQYVSVYENRTSNVDLKMKREPRDFSTSHHFIEPTYGYGVSLKNDAASTNYIGVNYGYHKSRVGMNTSLAFGIEHKDFSFSIGPAVRLTSQYSDVDVQLYAGPGFRYDPKSTAFDPVFKGNKWHLMGDAGIRLNFDGISYTDVSWASLYLGCKFSSNFVIPTVGVSLFPVAFALEDEETSFASHFINFIGGYDIGGEGMLGARYSWIQAHLGVYGSFMLGLKDASNFSVSLGPTFRFTDDYSDLDLQMYAGPAYIQNEFGGDMGLRFGWKSDYAISRWDFTLGCQVSKSHVIPTAGIGFFPAALATSSDEPDFASHFIDLAIGYDVDGETLMGAGYSWIKTHLGAYGSFLIGLEDSEMFTIAMGPVFRLTTDNSPLDLQIYGGPAYIYDEFGGDVGLRFGWKSNSSVSMWDFSIGCQASGSYVIPTISLGLGIALIGGITVPAIIYGDEE